MAELRIGSATDAGRMRSENEDNLLVTDRLFVVADGMGGHAAGEVASQIAVDRIAEIVGGDRLPSADDVVQAIRTANGDIYRASIANPGMHGMGTTVTAIGVIADPFAGRAAPNADVSGRRRNRDDDTSAERVGNGADRASNGSGDDGDDSDDAGGDGAADVRDADTATPDSATPGDVTPIIPREPSEALVLANVGDSRTYLYRHDRLRRVTIDHSYVQELVSTGHIDEEEARLHPRRNIITRSLGIEPDVRVDWWTLPLIRGDRFLLCSDGLVDEVPDADIAGALATSGDPQEAADRLVALANDAGGHDNITVIVVDVLDGDDPPDPTQEVDVVPRWADDTADPTPAGPLAVDADSTLVGVGTGAATTRQAVRRGSRRNLKWFAIGFAAAALLVAAFVVFSAWARSGYFVAFDDNDEAIIYRGREGGVLWISPTAENEVGPTRDELEPSVAAEIDEQPTFDSFEEAAEFIRDGVTTTTTTTTSTTTTTTTVPPTSTTGP